MALASIRWANRSQTDVNGDVAVTRLVAALKAPTAADGRPRPQRGCMLVLDGAEAGDGGDGGGLRAVIAVERRHRWKSGHR